MRFPPRGRRAALIGVAALAALLSGPRAGAQGPAATGAGAGDPYHFALFATPRAPQVHGTARLVFAASPFGVTVTADGRAVYDVQLSIADLPAATTLGAFSSYVAWAVTPDLTRWKRLGAVANGSTTIGPIDLNKFLLVITAERSPSAREHAGPTVLHGTSPSGWLQSFLSHPLFRGITGGG